MDNNLWRSKRRQAFLDEVCTGASAQSCQGLSQKALDSVATRFACHEQVPRDCATSAPCDENPRKTKCMCFSDDAALLRKRRFRAFAYKSEDRTLGFACDVEASQDARVTKLIEQNAIDLAGDDTDAQMLKVRRTRAFLGSDEATAIAASAASVVWAATHGASLCASSFALRCACCNIDTPKHKVAVTEEHSDDMSPLRARRRLRTLSIVVEELDSDKEAADLVNSVTKSISVVTSPSHGGA